MERILIRHLSGARAGEVDEFPAGATSEILVGRDPDAEVRFDPSREDLVSRHHVRIVRDPESPDEFSVVDLQSRNGTFLNRQRVYAPARITHHDVIQLGPAGPELRFELDPPPFDSLPPLRDTDMFGRSPGPGPLIVTTRDLIADSHAGSGLAPRPIGRATVERMLGDTFAKVKHESDKAVWVGAAALTAILVVGGITYMYQRQNATEANQQALENQQLIQQMGQDVKKTPEVAEAMRQEVIRLNNQLQLSDARNAERLQALSRTLAEQQAAAHQEQLAAARQAARELAGQPPQGQAAPLAPAGTPSAPPPAAVPDAPSSTPAPPAAPARDAGGKLDYDTTVRRGVDLLQNGDAAGALKLAQQLMESQPNRWEAYSIAGSVAKIQNRPSQAKSMFEKALSLAPDEVKASLQQALQEISRGGQ
jgi:tetratricopeptide (TPR) repeat protein